MRISEIKRDFVYLFTLILIVLGIPLAIWAYDRHLDLANAAPGAKEFVLTGHAQKGWVLGEVKANDILSLWKDDGPAVKPVVEVVKGDQVVLKLRSADVTHGFSLKAFGIYVAEGIQPGKTVYVSFEADKVGTFIFMCTVFCGDIHRHMEGTIVVHDETFRSKS